MKDETPERGFVPRDFREALERAAADVFVGRSRELAELEAALERAIAGRGALVLIAGEPGIGKTRLAERIAARAGELGAKVLWGRCWEGEGAPAFWPWLQVIRGYVRECDPPTLASRLGPAAPYLAQIVPEIRDSLPDLPSLPPLDSEQARFRLYEACSAFLRSAAADTPLVLVLDDLHWADKSSLLLLHFLAREIPEMRLLVLATYRDVEVMPGQPLGELLPRLRGERAVQRYLLRGLTESDVHAMLVAFRGEEVPDPFARSLADETAGNPLFIKEILRHLLDEGVAWREGERWVGRGEEIRLPESIRDVIGRRLARLSEPCRNLLATASVFGQEFGAETLGRVVELPRERVLELLEEAAASRVVIPVPQAIGRHRFSHALVREALYTGIRTIERLQLHRAIAAALERTPGAQLTELAHHHFEALPGGDVAKAVGYLTRAGDRASQQLAHLEAASLYGRALQALDLMDEPDETLRCELLLKVGEAHWTAGGFGDPTKVFCEAAELAEKIGAAELLARAALGLSGPGVGFAFTVVTAIEIPLLEKALAALDPTDSPLRARTMAKLAARYAFVRASPRAPAVATEAIEMARRLGDDATLAYVLNVSSWAWPWGPDRIDARFAIAEEIIRLGEKAGDARLAADGHRCRADCYLEVGDADAAQRDFEAQLRFAETSREPYSRWSAALRGAAVTCLEGRFRESERYLREASEAEAEVGQGKLYGTAAVARSLRQHQRLPTNEEMALSERLIATIPALVWARTGLACYYFRRGRVAEARRLYEGIAAKDFADLPRDYMFLANITIGLVDLTIDLDDPRRAAALYELALPYADRCALAGRVVCTGAVARSLGRLATFLRRFDDAERHFEVALEMNRRIRGRIWVAYTQHDYARMLQLRGAPSDRERARALWDEALASAREIGMAVLEGEIVTTLGELGLAPSDAKPTPASAAAEAIFRSDGEFWTVAYEGKTFRAKDAKGLRYIAHLLRNEGEDVHAAALAGGTGQSSVVDGGDAGEVLDAQARSEYKQRIEDLEGELDEATRWSDVGRASRCREELEFLQGELSAAVGLGGRSRRAANSAERARKAVASRIQDAIGKIRGHNPALALHFSNSIRLGTFCCYMPERPVGWVL